MPTLTITVTNQALTRLQAAVGDIKGDGPATPEEVAAWLREVPKELVRNYEHRVAVRNAILAVPAPIETQSVQADKAFVDEEDVSARVADVSPEAPAPVQVVAVVPNKKLSRWERFKRWFKRK